MFDRTTGHFDIDSKLQCAMHCTEGSWTPIRWSSRQPRVRLVRSAAVQTFDGLRALAGATLPRTPIATRSQLTPQRDLSLLDPLAFQKVRAYSGPRRAVVFRECYPAVMILGERRHLWRGRRNDFFPRGLGRIIHLMARLILTLKSGYQKVSKTLSRMELQGRPMSMCR
jgi:hypothetical protein